MLSAKECFFDYRTGSTIAARHGAWRESWLGHLNGTQISGLRRPTQSLKCRTSDKSATWARNDLWQVCYPAGRGAHQRLGTRHAFIIEDEYLISQSLRDMLEKLGFSRFSFARSEDAAVMGARAEPKIDLITTDVRLLPGDGVSAVQAICRKRDIPVVFITGYANELADRLPDATVVQKPVKQEQLAAAVREVLKVES